MFRKFIFMKNILLFFTALLLINGCNSKTPNSPLLIPELIDSFNGEPIKISLQHGEHEFYEGVKSATKGFNGDYLGPTIKLHKGKSATIKFTNNIGENTTVHGHGLHVNGNIDGGPQQVIKPEETWEIKIPVVQQAGMSWYHPHYMGKTSEHVHAGLAGIYLIEDENSKSLSLPKNYGVDDIPLIVQDRTFIKGEMKPYHVTHSQMMDGLREETLIANGTVNAYHTVPKGWVRLRLLNGSNARFYRFFLKSKAPFFKIATEGGFLNKPISLSEMTMAPGERNEIMVDLSNSQSDQLMAEFLPADPGDQVFFMDWFNPVATVVEFRTDTSIPAIGQLPEKLNTLQFFAESDQKKAVIREFHLNMEDGDDPGEGNDMNMNDMHNMFSINGKPMDMNRIDERVTKGQLELWRITADMMPHPFHVHGVSFQIVKHQGRPPAKADRGWKDTIVVSEEPTEILMRFNHIADDNNPYMYHCHILEHEDGGMMGQFTVQ